MELLEEILPDGSSYGVVLFDDPSAEVRAEVEELYNQAGSGLLNEEEMLGLMATPRDQLFEGEQLSTYKKAALWFVFQKPQTIARLKKINQKIARDFGEEGWEVRGGIGGEVESATDDKGAEDAISDWMFRNIQPPEKMAYRIFGEACYVIIFKPDEPPIFSEEEQEMLKSRVRKYTKDVFAEHAP